MLRCSWIIAVAIGLVALSGQAQQQAGDEQRQAEAEQAPPQPDVSPLPIKIIEDEATADARQRREQEARQREIDDLIAQQGMNEATRAMNSATQEMRDYAYAQTWLVGVGTALLFSTLWLTWRATKAATDAVSVTERIGKDQSRAYVQADTAEFFWGGEAMKFPRVKVRIINTGLTPAKWFRVRFAPTVYKRDESGTQGYLASADSLPDKYTDKWAGLSPGGDGRHVTCYIGEDVDVERACAFLGVTDFGFLLVGEIEYQTFFDEVFVTQFCFGTHVLRHYKQGSAETYMQAGVTINQTSEEPIPLSRYAADLATYQQRDKD